MKKFNLLAGAIVFAAITGAAAAAQAQDTGWYVGADVGMHYPRDMEVNYANIPGTSAVNTPANVTRTYGSGDDLTFDLRGGYRYAPNFRIEAQVIYEKGDAQLFALRTWQLFGNLYWDAAPDAVVSPFLGVGFGAQRTNFKAPLPIGVDDGDYGFVGQALAGLTWKSSDTTNVDLTGFYRRGSFLDFNTVGFGAGFTKPEEYGITLGFRTTLASPPPPPPAAK